MQTPQSQYENATAIRTDLGAIFVSLELSRATWLVTSLSPGGGQKMSKHMVQGSDIGELLSRFAYLQERVRCRIGRIVPIITIQEAGLMGFGFIGFWRSMASKVILSTPHQLPHHGVVGGPRPTGSMARRWYVLCSPSSVASLASVRWSGSGIRKKKTIVEFVVNDGFSLLSGLSMLIASRVCSLRRALAGISRCGRTDDFGSNSEPATAGLCRLISRRRSSANSIDLSFCSIISLLLSASATC